MERAEWAGRHGLCLLLLFHSAGNYGEHLCVDSVLLAAREHNYEQNMLAVALT